MANEDTETDEIEMRLRKAAQRLIDDEVARVGEEELDMRIRRLDAEAAHVGQLDQMIAGATDTAKVVSAFYISCVRQGVPAEVAASLAAAYLSVMLHNAAMHEGE